MSDPRYSYWRVWVDNPGYIRVARDDYQSKREGGPQLQPEHLEYRSDPPRGPYDIAWMPHEQAAAISEVRTDDFADALKEGLLG